MPSHREYSLLDSNQYFQITQFDRSFSRPVSFDEIAKSEMENGEFSIYRFEITKDMAERILTFLDREGLSTRGGAQLQGQDSQRPGYSRTVYTVRFSLHVVAGKRGGWYVLEAGGREPAIPNEFIEYGPMRKSGRRKNSRRRQLSFYEENEVRALEARTPSIEQMYRWIIRKYPTDVLNLDWSGDGRPLIPF